MNALLMVALVLTAGGDKPWEVRFDKADALADKNDFAGAEKELRAALKEAEKKGNGADDTSTALRWLGNNLSRQGRYAEAQKELERAQKLRLEAGLDTSDFANGLSDLYLSLGRYDDAEALLKNALPTLVKNYGAFDTRVATALNNLAAAHAYLEEPEAAERHYRQALAIRKKIDGEQSALTAQTLDNLGGVLLSLGRDEEAVKTRREAVRMYKETAGPTSPDYALALNNLAASLPSDSTTEQKKLYLEAIEVQRKVFGEDHPSLATSYANLGFALQTDGDLTGAKLYTEKALKIRKDKLGADHPLTWQVEDQLADVDAAIDEASKVKTKKPKRRH